MSADKTRARFIACRLPVLVCWTLGALFLDIAFSLVESYQAIAREWRNGGPLND